MDSSFDSAVFDLDEDVASFFYDGRFSDIEETILELQNDITDRTNSILTRQPTLLEDTEALLSELTNTNREVESISNKVLGSLLPAFELNSEAVEKKFDRQRALGIITRCLTCYLRTSELSHKCKKLLKHEKLEAASEFYVKLNQEFKNFEYLQFTDSRLCTEIAEIREEIKCLFDDLLLRNFRKLSSFDESTLTIEKASASSECVMRIAEKTDSFRNLFKVLRTELFEKFFSSLYASYQIERAHGKTALKFEFKCKSDTNSVKESLQDVTGFLETLKESFLGFTTSEMSFLRLFYANESYGHQLTKSIEERILKAKVPKTVNDLYCYDYSVLESCESTLCALGVASENCFAEFRKSLETHFVTSFVSDALAACRSLTLSDLSDTVVIECSRVDHESSKTSPKSVIPALSDENRHFMHRSLNQLPKMSIR